MSVAGAARTGQTVTGLIVGRRPVVDAALSVVGYRMALSGGRLTPELAWRGRGLAPVSGGRLLFIEPSRSFLLGEEDLPLFLDRAVLEVGPEVVDDAAVMDGVRDLIARGARLAVRRTLDPAFPPDLMGLADFILLDPGPAPDGLAFRLQYESDLAATVALSSVAGARVIALGVDSVASLNEKAAAGFSLFEGHLLSRARAAAAPAMTPSRAACFTMMQKVNDPETSASEIERLVETDPGLSYRMLHISGLGVDGGLRREVRSIREATVLLGREWIQKWLLMMVVADASQGTADQLTIAMSRARMCELLAAEVRPLERAAAFTVGLVSAMDALLGWPLPEVVSKLAITSDLKDALMHLEGPLGDILGDVLAWLEWNPGTPMTPLRCGVDPCDAERSYLDALDFATSVTDFLRGEGEAPAVK